MTQIYRPKRMARLRQLSLGRIGYSLRVWGDETARPILMLHGTQDCSATFQFVVDHLSPDWQVIAPDWRGHGFSDRADSYWFHDFVGDLSLLVDVLFAGRPVPVIGHSLGGNIAGIYAGLRPDRVSRLVSLDGFGPLVDHVPVDPLALFRSFLDTREPQAPRRYPDLEAMAARLVKANPALDLARARWLAQESSAELPGVGRRWLFVDGYRRSLPSLRNTAEWHKIWNQITAPVLWVESGNNWPNAPINHPEELDRRAAQLSNLRRVKLAGTHHNLHHDAPERVAREIEAFLLAEEGKSPC